MANHPPPESPPAGPALQVLRGGSRLSRVHSRRFHGDQFNPTLADPHWGGGRFDATPADRYAYLYAGEDDECAVCEALLREVPLEPGGGRCLPRAAIADRVLSRLVLSADLSVISLCDGSDLARLGQDDNWLVSCPASEYGFSRRWGHALRRWAPRAEGIVWPSRRDPSKRTYVLFEDRFSAALDVEETSPLDSGAGEKRLLEILQRYWVTLAP